MQETCINNKLSIMLEYTLVLVESTSGCIVGIYALSQDGTMYSVWHGEYLFVFEFEMSQFQQCIENNRLFVYKKWNPDWTAHLKSHLSDIKNWSYKEITSEVMEGQEETEVVLVRANDQNWVSLGTYTSDSIITCIDDKNAIGILEGFRKGKGLLY